MRDFSLLITNWYRQNKRDLPWRDTNNPYKIWLSEILLQQTRVSQGLPYYQKFIKNFPTVNDLANSDEQKVLKLWQGLGYYSRARNLHHAAKTIRDEHKSKFPDNYKEIRALKGVGDYTAAAVASFAFNIPKAVVDGNVYRVLSRYFNDPEPIDTAQGKKLFQKYAEELLPHDNSAEHNQAIMELGAIVCTPKSPDCDNCPLNEACLANRMHTIDQLPVKSKKTKVTNKYFYYLFENEKSFSLEKRTSGIWKNMFQLPLIESNEKLSFGELEKKAKKKYNLTVLKKGKISTYKHILSHQKINAEFWRVKDKQHRRNDKEINISLKSINEYPIPRVIDRFFEDNFNEYNE